MRGNRQRSRGLETRVDRAPQGFDKRKVDFMVPFILFLMTSVGAEQALSQRVEGRSAGCAKSALSAAVAEAGCGGCCDSCPCKETGVCDCSSCPCQPGAAGARARASAQAKAPTASPKGACCAECADGCPLGCCDGGCCKASAAPERSSKSCCSTVGASRS